ncbi:NADPH-dependent ferric siderophore reductase [Agaricicola taiwanensis]|uniref:NADPH-dependent ferric siderophore reductase n=1 Tax=Agaricicola taiwanensis TaxID=591372 RepID=A0A8J3E0B8_9RHOB|nr:siderophore-interacting protein [Agaricicola taiwanensis]GGE53963.1 NADPH-dependent ferric siderophore reductase [Agaricicola taiwanensis]
MTFTATARVAGAADDTIIARTCEHLEEHDAEVTIRDGYGEARFPKGSASLRREGAELVLTATAPALDDLIELRGMLAFHVIEFSAAAPSIIWTGDGNDATTPPGFRLMTVRHAMEIGPRMRRVTLHGENLSRYATASDLHVKLLLPPDGVQPRWPSLKADGTIAWPEGEAKLAARKYTIRRIDVAAGEIDIDFVLHDHGGPGSRFGARARPGDVIGMTGPGGRSVGEADFYLLAGDETALPAIARIMEMLPPEARGVAMIEVEEPGDEQLIETRANIDLRWLHRSRGGSLARDVPDIALPQAKSFAWVGAEFGAFRELRRHFRAGIGLPRDQHLVVSYWRRGEVAH